MKILLAFCLLYNCIAFAQIPDSVVQKEDKIICQIEPRPQFPGGDQALTKFIKDNLRYPEIARENNVQGKVFASFIVEIDGRLTNFKILRGLGYGCDEEAIRLLKTMPKWVPSREFNDSTKFRRVQFTQPILFKIHD
jgi:periplasmic protein TonB